MTWRRLGFAGSAEFNDGMSDERLPAALYLAEGVDMSIPLERFEID